MKVSEEVTKCVFYEQTCISFSYEKMKAGNVKGKVRENKKGFAKG